MQKDRLTEQHSSERQPAPDTLQTALEETRQREVEITALLEASRAALRHREFEPAARAILDSCKSLIGATAGYMALLTEDGTEDEVLLIDSGGHPRSIDPTRPMPARGLREKVYRTGQTVYENDFSNTEWARFIPPGHAGIDNVLFAPLLIQGIAVGHLGLANKPGSFTLDDARLASAFGEMVALALLNSRALESLQKSEESFRAVAQTASDAIITVNSRRDIVFWNKAAEKIFGHTLNEAIGQPLSFILPDRSRTTRLKNTERLILTGKANLVAQTLELVGLRKDGDEFPIELSLSTWESQGENFVTSIIRDVTKARRMDEALRESEVRWRSLAESSPDNILTLDTDLTIQYANYAAPGLTVEDLIGTPLFTYVAQERQAEIKRILENVLQTGEPATYETEYESPDGTIYYESHVVPRERAGEVIGLTLNARDITERKRAQEEITSLARFPSENRYPVLRVSGDGTVRYANAASAPLLVMWDSQLGQKLPDALHQLTVDALGSGDSRTTEVLCEERIFSLDLAPVQEAGYVNLYGRDITKSKQAEELLKAQNQFITTVVEALNYPFYVINAFDYTIKMANSAAHSGELPEGLPCFALTHKRTHPCAGDGHPCPLEMIKETKQPVMVEHTHYDREGNRKSYEVHGYPVFDDQGAIIQIVEYTLDITQRRRADEALRERTFQLGERIKELNCLYGISALVEKPDISLPEILQGTVDLVSPAWQYPEITSARITMEGQAFRTENFTETTSWQQTADIMVYGAPIGALQVCYLEERPVIDEGPFLREERSLVNAIAERLGKVTERMRAEGALQGAHDELAGCRREHCVANRSPT